MRSQEDDSGDNNDGVPEEHCERHRALFFMELSASYADKAFSVLIILVVFACVLEVGMLTLALVHAATT